MLINWPSANTSERVIPKANPIVIGGVAADMMDLKNRPTRIRISSMVNGSIFARSSIVATSASYPIAAVPVTKVVMATTWSSASLSDMNSDNAADT